MTATNIQPVSGLHLSATEELPKLGQESLLRPAQKSYGICFNYDTTVYSAGHPALHIPTVCADRYRLQAQALSVRHDKLRVGVAAPPAALPQNS